MERVTLSTSEHLRQTYPIGIIGVSGKIGRLFAESFSDAGFPVYGIVKPGKQELWQAHFGESVSVSADAEELFAANPNLTAVLLATPRPVTSVVSELAQVQGDNIVVVLLQNGVDVIDEAKAALGDEARRFHLIRGSVFTVVGEDKGGAIRYNKNRKRIAIAADPADEAAGEMQPTIVTLMTDAGFRVASCRDAESLEWTKLMMNVIGSTGVITGFTPRETFTDPYLFALEMRALKDRMMLLQAVGISLQHLGFSGLEPAVILSLARYLPEYPPSFIRSKVAEFIAQERDNRPPANAEKVWLGLVSEVKFYHQPFVELSGAHGYRSPVDELILEVSKEVVNIEELCRYDLIIKKARERRLLQP